MSVYCSRCGSENSDDSKFCYHCGARFAGRQTEPDARYSPDSPSGETGTSHESPDDANRSFIEPGSHATGSGEEFDGKTPPGFDGNQEPSANPRPGRESYRSFEFPSRPVQTVHRTFEQVTPGLEPASFGIRFVAFFIDFVILSLVTQIGVRIADFDLSTFANDPSNLSRLMDEYFSFAFTGNMGPLLSQYMESFMMVAALQTILVFAYYFLFHAICGQTPGKFALGIKVTRTNGSPVGFTRSFFRYVLYWLGAKIVYVGSFWALFNRQVATWHDLACDTRVYKTSSLEEIDPDDRTD